MIAVPIPYGSCEEALPATSGKGLSLATLPSYLVEVLAAYSHSIQTSDLHLCHQRTSLEKRPRRWPATKRAWSLADRLDEAQVLTIVENYLSGATAAQLASAYGLSLSSLKRLLRSAQATKTRY
jgi:hypothetical protein